MMLFITQDTGTVLMPTDIKYYQMFGGQKVIFEKEEVTEIKDFGPTGNVVHQTLHAHMLLLRVMCMYVSGVDQIQ